MVGFIIAVIVTLIIMVATRAKDKLTTESPERKLVNKAVGLVMCITYFLLFVPMTTFSSRLLICDKTQQQEGNCYTGSHLVIFCFVVLGLGLHLFLIMYASTMLTTCYPHSSIPWAHFPSNVPFYKLAVRLPIVLVY